MSRGMRLLSYAAGAFAMWLVGLVVIGAVHGPRTGDSVARRLGDSLVAPASVGDADLALVRGRLALDRLQVRKDDVGHLALDVAAIRCELPPLGLALVDRTCRELVIDGFRLEASSAAVLQPPRQKRAPIRAERVEIRDAVLAFAPSAFVPGLGRIELAIEHVVAGPTTFKTPLSWVFALRELRARLALPGSITLNVGYADGVLTATGGIFGSRPVAIPVAIPVADAADDAQAETTRLVRLGRDLAERLVARRAQDWLRSTLAR